MDNLTIWNINGVELEFDITEADSADRYEQALAGLQEDIPKTKPTSITTSKFIRAYCKAHRNLYDKLFGKGTSEKIFENIPESMRKYNSIYANFLAFVAMQSSTLHDEIQEIEKKYLPDSKNQK